MELDDEGRRSLAAALFNHVWTLLRKEERTVADDDEMVHAAHASAYHWMGIGTAANRARSEWQCSRVYAVLGRAEPALHHARRCLEIAEASPGEMEDWDVPFRVRGAGPSPRRRRRRGRGPRVADPGEGRRRGDRRRGGPLLLESDLATIGT
jgi:hypothetical protein